MNKDKDLIDFLIDNTINLVSVEYTIKLLLEYGLTREELVSMKFNYDDITDIEYEIQNESEDE